MLIQYGSNVEPIQEIFLRNAEVEKLTGTKLRQRKRYEAAGRFPKSIMVGPKTRVWRKSDIDRWMAERIGA